MLAQEENDLITRVGLGTPLNVVMRSYWLPTLLSREIPEPDGPPVRVRVLGEDLVAFRDSGGKVGLLGEHCPHRGTSLFFGRNEECGLRCIYHGWKMDVEGKVLDTPAEPAGSTLKDKVRHSAYPCHEAAGIIFAYMGARDRVPLFPAYDWIRAPLDQLYVTKSLQDCNYLQGLEGECDSSHLSYLHRAFSNEKRGGGDPDMYGRDGAPELESVETDFGARMISRRAAGNGLTYLRVSNFVLPCYGFVPTGGLKGNPEGYTIHAHVPVDDERSLRFNILYRRKRPVLDPEKRLDDEFTRNFTKVRNIRNDYLIDREEQKRETFIGLGKSFVVHDSCATESMGPRYDRSREHLGASDITVIGLRKRLLSIVHDLERGKEPPHLIRTPQQNDVRHIACIVTTIPSSIDPKQHVAELLRQENYWEATP
jgi:phenylpropionate dioxygenase-like ring-hydroxylating dioxygenase large terminal subunit